jgi:hypothetical protein
MAIYPAHAGWRTAVRGIRCRTRPPGRAACPVDSRPRLGVARSAVSSHSCRVHRIRPKRCRIRPCRVEDCRLAVGVLRPDGPCEKPRLVAADRPSHAVSPGRVLPTPFRRPPHGGSRAENGGRGKKGRLGGSRWVVRLDKIPCVAGSSRLAAVIRRPATMRAHCDRCMEAPGVLLSRRKKLQRPKFHHERKRGLAVE